MQKSIDCIKNNYEKMTETAHYLAVELGGMEGPFGILIEE